MDIKPQVGEAAGEIWQLLKIEGPQTLTQLKKKLGGSNELATFALGWLAREDKVEVTKEKNNYTVALK